MEMVKASHILDNKNQMIQLKKELIRKLQIQGYFSMGILLLSGGLVLRRIFKFYAKFKFMIGNYVD